MNWEKTGFLFDLNKYTKEYRGAAVPMVLKLYDGVYRIYYTARDKNGCSNIFYVDVDIISMKVISVVTKPILSQGELGCFDDRGAMTSWILKGNEYYYLYYTGWNLGKTVPFHNSIGLAVSEDGINFKRKYTGPVLDREKYEPIFCSNPCVIKENDIWRMWYISCVKWIYEAGKTKHYYHIKYAESMDGIEWKREGKVCIDFKNDAEYALSRPCVLKMNGLYRMFYSYRGDKYRIGYAESQDGIEWTRKDAEAGISVSDDGFDSDMICYAYVFECEGEYYMLYNGNEYGMTGFGIAKLQESGH